MRKMITHFQNAQKSDSELYTIIGLNILIVIILTKQLKNQK